MGSIIFIFQDSANGNSIIYIFKVLQYFVMQFKKILNKTITIKVNFRILITNQFTKPEFSGIILIGKIITL